MAKYFSEAELKCKCGCGEAKTDLDFLSLLDLLREEFGKPVILSSAYRCPEYNAKVSSTGANGPHTTGKAVDILARGTDAYTIMKIATKLGFTGIGVSQRGVSRFIHLDTLVNDMRPWVWSY